MAESAFHISTPEEKPQEQREIRWEEDATHSKKWGKKPDKPKAAGPDAAAYLMRTDAPDFEWPQPWEQVWADQSIPSASSAHYLIERTNKLWESELASFRPLWFGARTGICPALSCVIEVICFDTLSPLTRLDGLMLCFAIVRFTVFLSKLSRSVPRAPADPAKSLLKSTRNCHKSKQCAINCRC